MYLPKSKYSKPKLTPGKQFTLPDGTEYKGWYFKTYKGEQYTGSEPYYASEQLTRMSLIDAVGSTLGRVNFIQLLITNSDLIKGFIKRLFVKNKIDGKIIEVTQDQVQDYSEINYYQISSLDWNITSPAEDVVVNGFVYEGSISKNKKAVEELNKTFTGISSYITDYSKYVQQDKTVEQTVDNGGNVTYYIKNNITGEIKQVDEFEM